MANLSQQDVERYLDGLFEDAEGNPTQLRLGFAEFVFLIGFLETPESEFSVRHCGLPERLTADLLQATGLASLAARGYVTSDDGDRIELQKEARLLAFVAGRATTWVQGALSTQGDAAKYPFLIHRYKEIELMSICGPYASFNVVPIDPEEGGAVAALIDTISAQLEDADGGSVEFSVYHDMQGEPEQVAVSRGATEGEFTVRRFTGSESPSGSEGEQLSIEAFEELLLDVVGDASAIDDIGAEQADSANQ